MTTEGRTGIRMPLCIVFEVPGYVCMARLMGSEVQGFENHKHRTCGAWNESHPHEIAGGTALQQPRKAFL